MRAMDEVTRAVMSVAQAKARAVGARELDLPHVAWALDALRAGGQLDRLAESLADETLSEESPRMLPFSSAVADIYDGARSDIVTVDMLQTAILRNGAGIGEP